MSVADIAKKYGISRQAVYQRIKADDKKREAKNTSGYGLNLVRGVGQGEHRLIDPETGLVVENKGNALKVIGRMGDEKVTEFVQYHLDMLQMRSGVDKSNVDELYQRFAVYLAYCAQHGIIPNNMNCYFALGLARQDISAWHRGVSGTPRHREFADTVMDFFASVHEQAATDGIVNPIYSMWLQKAHDKLIEAQKAEEITDDPLGSRVNSEDIVKKYGEFLPDDS